jgi:hypothetical protein
VLEAAAWFCRAWSADSVDPGAAVMPFAAEMPGGVCEAALPEVVPVAVGLLVDVPPPAGAVPTCCCNCAI